MQNHYNHLSTEERVTLMLMRRQGESLRAIGQVLGRSASTMSRELRRNSEAGGYETHAANAQARERRHRQRRQRRLSPGSELLAVVMAMLAKGYSPEQISARLKLNWPDRPEWQVSHETIYLTIYAYPANWLVTCVRGKVNGGVAAPTKQGVSAIWQSRTSASAQRRSRAGKCQGTGKVTW